MKKIPSLKEVKATSTARPLGTQAPGKGKAKAKKLRIMDAPQTAPATIDEPEPDHAITDALTDEPAPSVTVEDEEKNVSADEKVLAIGSASTVESKTLAVGPQEIVNVSKGNEMTLTLKGISKSGKFAIYTGLAVAVRIGVSAFENKQPPASFEASGEGLAGPKAKETKEERKARLAALPKPTQAERVAALEAKLAKARAKLEQPSA